MESKFLYGASVQGIQNFIFQTSKLAEIVGASELVEQICTSFFKGQIGGGNFKEENLILGAAGNIKYIFDDARSCQELVRKFPKAVMEMAPGITISQSVVELKEGTDAIDELEKRLRVQRNKPISITDGVGLMVTETARKTGGIGFKFESEDDRNTAMDKGQFLKRKEADKANKKLIKKMMGEAGTFADKFPFDIGDIVKKESNKSWIAVIHADGNNLGKKIKKLGEKLKEKKGMDAFKEFSNLLNSTTINAARKAFDTVVITDYEKNNLERLPFRPVVLGGDDLTAIIRGDLALDYTSEFLETFEALSKANFESFARDNNLDQNPFKDGLTACAGIAYIKANYPFHYGFSLAEKLCQEAKKVSKDINRDHSPSSLMFHKVHASFVEEYDDIVDAELKGPENIYFNYGPYFVQRQDQFSTIKELQNRLKAIKRKDAPKAGLRNWLTELRFSPENGSQTLERIASLNKKFEDILFLKDPFTVRKVKTDEGEGKFTPIFDTISLSNI